MKKVIKVLSTSILFLLAIFAAVIMFYFFQSKGNIEKAPSLFGYKPLTILSNSMKPTFDAGDIILTNVNKEPKVGDVITYKHPDGILVTHRAIGIVKKNGITYFQAKGDNNNIDDKILIPRADILGVQTHLVPYIGYLAKFTSGPIGFIMLIVVPLVLFIIIEIFQRLGLIGNKKSSELHS